MAVRWKDVPATVLTALAVLVFLAAHQSWNVPLVGDSYRWAGGAILVLGMATCTLGDRSKGTLTMLLAALGIVALALAVLVMVTNSLTALSFLAGDFVLLWLLATLEHVVDSHAAPPGIHPV